VVVAADVGGLPEVVVNGETGLLHRKEDVNDLVKAVSQLIENPSLVTSMSQAAVNRAKLFTTEQYDTLIADLYAKLI
jgi:glycosyltransferase involved in cell wall biosynthesis